MSKETQSSRSPGAAGYAMAVDAAMESAVSAKAWASDEMHDLFCKLRRELGLPDYSSVFEVSTRVLSMEVLRLREILKRGRDMINTPADSPEWEWPTGDEIDQFVADCDSALGKSHNHMIIRHLSDNNKSHEKPTP